MPIFKQGRRMVPDNSFYLIDIISEKILSRKVVLTGRKRHDAKMRQRKSPSCEKKAFLRTASQMEPSEKTADPTNWAEYFQ